MTPHDCATQGHRWEPVVTTWCETCGHGDESVSLDSLLRRALTDAVLRGGSTAYLEAKMPLGGHQEPASLEAQRQFLITAILTAARETGHD